MTLKCDHIEWLITLSSDYIKRLLLYYDGYSFNLQQLWMETCISEVVIVRPMFYKYSYREESRNHFEKLLSASFCQTRLNIQISRNIMLICYVISAENPDFNVFLHFCLLSHNVQSALLSQFCNYTIVLSSQYIINIKITFQIMH